MVRGFSGGTNPLKLIHVVRVYVPVCQLLSAINTLHIASCFPGDKEPCDVNAGYDHSVILTKGGQVNLADMVRFVNMD